MGHHHSKSRPDDVTSNVVWVLQQLMHWETRFVDDSLVAYARCAPPAEPEMREQEAPAAAAAHAQSLAEEKLDEPRRRGSMTEIEHRWLSREPVGSQVLEITPESPPSKDAEVLDSKFHFVYVLLRKMLKSAERNWMLHEKNAFLKQQHGHTKDKTQRKLILEHRMDENQHALNSALGAYDNARSGMVWLQKQYDLGLTMIKLKNGIAQKQEELEALGSGNYSPKELEHKTTAIKQQLKQLHDKLVAAEKQQRGLQKESLDVGLKYLDANCSGSIEPEDVPTMTAELFNLLDINKNHAITPAELQTAVSKMEANLDDLRARRDSLREAHNKLEQKRMGGGTSEKTKTKGKTPMGKCCSQADVHEQTEVEMMMNEEKQAKLEHEIDQQQKVLQEVFRVFESSFTMNVFSKLEGWDALLALPKEGSPITCSMAAVARRPNMVERLLDATSVVTEEEEQLIGVVGPSPLYHASTSPPTPREGSTAKPLSAGEEGQLERPPTPALETGERLEATPPTPLDTGRRVDTIPATTLEGRGGERETKPEGVSPTAGLQAPYSGIKSEGISPTTAGSTKATTPLQTTPATKPFTFESTKGEQQQRSLLEQEPQSEQQRTTTTQPAGVPPATTTGFDQTEPLVGEASGQQIPPAPPLPRDVLPGL